MPELTGKQRRYLRALGNDLKPVVMVGRCGLAEPVLRALAEAFHQAELVKVKLQEGFLGDRFEVAEELAKSVSAQLVQVLGRTILLYRRHLEKPRITLP
ncbi:MAG: ribosome assembly RNA-binding protein YhbY [candidate division KSB1 bacterium]|nr:ribosome assembly RNA-binding protein YhbY [candidate division KSB1 bacterium]MDZ7275935.1 ribosome assembly RNA-binding protein YhbY [candidate division KSB1 bacterium]MDZ7285783.1 ribosome assembly RNA-binding protein YhbY [candidate division KSB1 bacterium]MDZ7298815.1 ribosome assembly RNA-binding protein YhbY [candidate division KSB1 bacterium]MDZ7309443.1 ribosome assembly RNA-binding protein YhbY [candidate division KSB1 bacterium]